MKRGSMFKLTAISDNGRVPQRHRDKYPKRRIDFDVIKSKCQFEIQVKAFWLNTIGISYK